MYYTIYKVTNKIDGKFYIGSHKTKNLDDKYMGSGKYLIRAQEKYGLENFEKEILFIFDTPEEMYAKEAEIVNEDFLMCENTYNLKCGGFGGWDYINDPSKFSNPTRTKEFASYRSSLGLNARKEALKKLHYNNEWALIQRKKIKLAMKEYYKTNDGSFLGKKHSDETKRKIGQKNSEKQTGINNSQYGTRWIHNEELKVSKKILKTDPLPENWKEGRKIKWRGSLSDRAQVS